MNKLSLALSVVFFVLSCTNQKKTIINNQIPAERYIVYNNFPSKYVSPRNIEVWLPDGYDNIKALPVLYMFDGQNIFHGKKGWINNTYNHGWQVDETLDSLFHLGSVPRMIVVGIFNTGIKRVSEYMPAQPIKEIEKRIIQAEKLLQEDYEKYGITSDQFLKFIVRELIPFIDINYKTIEGRSGTYLAGSSMGGLISAYGICEYPDVFGGAACFSTHWSILDGVFIEYLKNHIPNSELHKLYFDYGTLGLDSEYESYQLIVDSLMMVNGYEENKNWITKKFENDNHNEDFWRARFHYPIEFFFKNID
jgi:predicted alpha/beta superfamily hydrolase|tara:strand:+ start:99 stop:1019 length:921 start_codon:yes stop_codon:yes gene_type:complete